MNHISSLYYPQAFIIVTSLTRSASNGTNLASVRACSDWPAHLLAQGPPQWKNDTLGEQMGFGDERYASNLPFDFNGGVIALLRSPSNRHSALYQVVLAWNEKSPIVLGPCHQRLQLILFDPLIQHALEQPLVIIASSSTSHLSTS